MRGKRNKADVQEFQADLMHHILTLHQDLKTKTYTHGGYHHFKISDPKPRDIHKASVRDRLLHHALYRQLYPFFDKTFIADSYSCRLDKGTHKAINRFRTFAYKVSKNRIRTAWVLKCDIKKFFASIDHTVLEQVLKNRITNPDILWLLGQVVSSFRSNVTRFNLETINIKDSPCSKIGLPLGNLTSQLLVNIYMNEFDQYVKHKLKQKYYIRYADDFVLLSQDRKEMEQALRYIVVFLRDQLKLQLHPDKVHLATFASGVDFLGWVHFADHRVLRASTKRRMFKRVAGLDKKDPTIQSYVGLLSHGNARKLSATISP